MIDIDGHSLTLENVEAVARGAAARLSAEARTRVERSRAMVDAIVREGRPVYGISTGVGRLCTVTIPPADAQELQHNILRSHAAGVGVPLDEPIVRAMMVLRANALACGYSGVRPVIVERLLEMLAGGVHPVIPSQGSLGASGDLAPLAHMALPMIGLGRARIGDGGDWLPGAEAMRRAGIALPAMEGRDGIALINGTEQTTGIGALAVRDAFALAALAEEAAALALEALGAVSDSFDHRTALWKGHPGQVAVSARLRALTEGSAGVLPPRPGRLRDALSLRCVRRWPAPSPTRRSARGRCWRSRSTPPTTTRSSASRTASSPPTPATSTARRRGRRWTPSAPPSSRWR